MNSMMLFIPGKKPGPPYPPKLEPVKLEGTLMEEKRKSTGDK